MMSEQRPDGGAVKGPSIVCADCGQPIPLEWAAGPAPWKTVSCPGCGLVIHLGRGTVSEHRFR
jgi:hypothetical protein